MPVGTVLSGKYRVERFLGSGGMGAVLACRHLQLGQTVAIKLLLPSVAEEPHFVNRLVREARAAAALKGEHVARVFDVDRQTGGAPYIVMEYLEGETLAALLKARGRLEPQLAVEYALQVCEALAEAHALGIVHRDLKPSNLFLARKTGHPSSLRVLDFGISKALDLGSPELHASTDSHAFVGSPAYASPEQLVTPRDVDARTDVWSLGIVLYQCLSGEPPFNADTLPKLWDSILRREAPPLSSGDLGVPEGLERVVRRCLEKERERRYGDVCALARDLLPFAPSRAQASLSVITALSQRAAAPEGSGVELAYDAADPALSQENTLTEAPLETPAKGVTPRPRARPRIALLIGGGALAASLIALALIPRVPSTEPAALPHRQATELAPSPRATLPPRATPALEPPPAPEPARVPPAPEREKLAQRASVPRRVARRAAPPAASVTPVAVDLASPPSQAPVSPPVAPAPPDRGAPGHTESDEEAAYSDRE